MTKVTKILKNIPLYVWILVFTIIPLLMILVYAIFEFSPDGVRFTLDPLKNAFTNGSYWGAMLRSFNLAVISTLVCLVLGYPLAYFLSQLPEKKRNFVTLLMLLPMWMNFLIRTYALMSLIDEEGIVNLKGTDAAVVIGMVYNFLPFLVLPIYTSMMKIDRNLIEAAQDLGGNTFHVFKGVILPLTLPGIISGITMVFIPCLTTFVIPNLLNSKTWTIGRLIEYKFMSETSAYSVSSEGAALSFILMIAVFICMSIFNKLDKDDESAGGLAL